MKKNLNKLFYLSFLLFALLFVACEKDLYENVNTTSKFNVKHVKFSEVETNVTLMKALKRQKLQPTTIAGKTVFDSIYNYSIDTDRVLYMEGEDFNSYTFLIEKDGIEKDGIQTVDNLVLMSQPGDYYAAFVISYSLTDEERESIKKGEKFDFTGKSTAYGLNSTQILDDIFSKEYYNESCSMEYSWQEVITITPCPIDGCWDPAWTGESISHVLVGNLECTGGTSTTGNGGTQAGGGGGGGISSQIATTPNLPELEDSIDPCLKAKPATDKANALLQNNNVQTGMNAVLRAKVIEEGQLPFNDQREWGVAIGQTGTVLNLTPPLRGDANQGSIPSSQAVGNYVADGHTHPTWGDACASGADFYGMLNIVRNNSYYYSRFVYGIGKDINGNDVTEVYAIMVTDRNAAINFLNQYPELENINPMSGSFYKDTKLGVEYLQIRDKFKYSSNNINEDQYSAGAVALSYILKKYNTGISVAKVDSNGYLKVLDVSKESTGSTSNEFKITAKKCP